MSRRRRWKDSMVCGPAVGTGFWMGVLICFAVVALAWAAVVVCVVLLA